MHDVVIVGAGPVGLACGIEAGREGLRPLLLDKGTLVNSIVGYPAGMEFFSTPELIEIGAYPFPVQQYKPTREEAIEYYRGVTAREQLDVRLYERVLQVDGDVGGFTVVTTKRRYASRHIVVAIGFFDQPNRLNVSGEDLPKVTHYYREPYPYVRQKVAIIGARNSAAKAALDCYRRGHARRAGAGAVGQDQVLDQAGPRESHQGGERPGVFQHDRRGDPRVVHCPQFAQRRHRDRERLGAGDDRIPPRLQLPGNAADCDWRRRVPHAEGLALPSRQVLLEH
jgi:hypothetical protein